MRIIKILSLICFLTIGIWAQADATLTGQVTANFPQTKKNEKTIAQTIVSKPTGNEIIYYERKPVAGVVVSLKNKPDGEVLFKVITDANGIYSFNNIPAGRYFISAAGKVTDESESDTRVDFEETTVKNGKVKNVNLYLYTQIYISSLPRKYEVTVIASGTNQTIEQVSKTVNIIDSQELRDRADFALVESLKTIPGFRVQQSGGFGRLATIKTRGLRNQDTAILIDGIRFRDASAITGDASTFLSDFTLTSVSKIEVLRGSGSSLYGTNAIGGTIDFQTPKPQSGMHGQIGGAFGGLGLGRFRGNFSDGRADNKFGYNLGVFAHGLHQGN